MAINPVPFLNAIPGAMQVAGVAAQALTPEARDDRKRFRELLKKSRQNAFGKTQGEVNQMVGQAGADIAAANRAIAAETARGVAAGGMSAGQVEQLRKLQSQNLGALASARAGAEAASVQQAGLERQELDALKAQRREQTANLIGGLVGMAAPFIPQNVQMPEEPATSEEGSVVAGQQLAALFSKQRKAAARAVAAGGGAK